MQVYGLRLVGLLQAALQSTNGSLSAEQHMPPEQLRDVVFAAGSSALQCIAADASVLSSTGRPAGVACCRLSCHCRALHEGATLQVWSMLFVPRSQPLTWPLSRTLPSVGPNFAQSQVSSVQ